MGAPAGVCQLMNICDAGQKLNRFDLLRFFLYSRGPAALQRRLKKWKGMLGLGGERVSGQPHGNGSSAPEARSGARLVRVKNFEEIGKTLDSKGCCRGLMFMPGQKKFCGRTFEVMKEVRWMFDERSWEMKKLNNVFLLKDVFCDGADLFDKEGCARSCFYFWKADWLGLPE